MVLTIGGQDRSVCL